jgi:hypothetical protein
MTWILIVFLMHHDTVTYGGNAAGVAQIEFKTKQQCADALAQAKRMATFRDGSCIERISPFGPKP